jgi:hypothetical protein
LSSAILYLAIVAIWACVLIPRWLKRDSARGPLNPADHPPAHPAVVIIDDSAPGVDTGAAGDNDAGVGGEPYPRRDGLTDADVRGPRTVPEPLSPQESRRRMRAARLRLLLMLTGLEIAAIMLALLGLAAPWVFVPPTLMLVGYVLLLREAAQADRERAEAEAEAEAAARRRARERDRARIAARAGRTAPPVPGAPTAAEHAAELAAKFAAAPVAADYEDAAPGRDFAPGLAGKYTTSTAEAEAADEDYYDNYDDPPHLRAVGD